MYIVVLYRKNCFQQSPLFYIDESTKRLYDTISKNKNSNIISSSVEIWDSFQDVTSKTLCLLIIFRFINLRKFDF